MDVAETRDLGFVGEGGQFIYEDSVLYPYKERFSNSSLFSSVLLRLRALNYELCGARFWAEHVQSGC